MTEIEIAEDPDESREWDPPSYKTPGRILVRSHGPAEPYEDGRPSVYRFSTEVLDHDSNSSVFWINEGVGFDFWLDSVDELEKPGVYVIEGITGDYIRGDGWTFDDDEEWDWQSVRPATQTEIDGEALDDIGD